MSAALDELFDAAAEHPNAPLVRWGKSKLNGQWWVQCGSMTESALTLDGAAKRLSSRVREQITEAILKAVA